MPDDELAEIDIGFTFLQQFKNKGYAFESVNKLLEVAIHDFKIKQISAITTNANVASQKLLAKIGLIFKEHITIPNDEKN